MSQNSQSAKRVWRNCSKAWIHTKHLVQTTYPPSSSKKLHLKWPLLSSWSSQLCYNMVKFQMIGRQLKSHPSSKKATAPHHLTTGRFLWQPSAVRWWSTSFIARLCSTSMPTTSFPTSNTAFARNGHVKVNLSWHPRLGLQLRRRRTDWCSPTGLQQSIW